jgi:tRNA (guanine26-N2/guanine27-N2)-dimethyltransferase
VFYNGAMSLDRDLHVAVVAAWARSRGRPGSAWEMLGATGVRGLRVLVESGGIDRLVSTDAGGPAAHVLAENARRYSDRGARSRQWDARSPIDGGPFDHVDLDPFGSPLPFLDAAIDSLAPDGLISVTATDMIVLAGVDSAATRRRYDANPVQGRLGPEGGLRILLRTLSDRAVARGRAIHPLVGYVRDHYVRAYATVRPASGAPAVGTIDPLRWDGPPFRSSGPVGPMWLGPLFDREFVAGLAVPVAAANPVALARLLGRFQDESLADVPFYFEPNLVARDTGLAAPPPSEWFVDTLRAQGHPTGRTHARDGAFRTRAPREVVYAVARTHEAARGRGPTASPDPPVDPGAGTR